METAAHFKERRLRLNITQADLASRANVSLGSVRKFEQTGEIGYKGLLRLSYVLEFMDDILKAMKPEKEFYQSIDEILEEDNRPKRKRASRHED